jgi:hypothetical protein
MKLLGITNVDFIVIGKRLVKFSISGKYWGGGGIGRLIVQRIDYL